MLLELGKLLKNLINFFLSEEKKQSFVKCSVYFLLRSAKIQKFGTESTRNICVLLIWVIISLQLIHRYLLNKVFSRIWYACSGLSRIFDHELNQLFSIYQNFISVLLWWVEFRTFFSICSPHEFLTIAKSFYSIYLNLVSVYAVMHFIMMSSELSTCNVGQWFSLFQWDVQPQMENFEHSI